MTNPPPVAPVEGHYAFLRDSSVIGPLICHNDGWFITNLVDPEYSDLDWWSNGQSIKDYRGLHHLDIIATISPADMQAVASGELERLKEALELAIAANCKMKDALSFYADDGPTPNVDGPWKATSWDFGAFARCTLADVANIEGGKNP